MSLQVEYKKCNIIDATKLFRKNAEISFNVPGRSPIEIVKNLGVLQADVAEALGLKCTERVRQLLDGKNGRFPLERNIIRVATAIKELCSAKVRNGEILYRKEKSQIEEERKKSLFFREIFGSNIDSILKHFEGKSFKETCLDLISRIYLSKRKFLSDLQKFSSDFRSDFSIFTASDEEIITIAKLLKSDLRFFHENQILLKSSKEKTNAIKKLVLNFFLEQVGWIGEDNQGIEKDMPDDIFLGLESGEILKVLRNSVGLIQPEIGEAINLSKKRIAQELQEHYKKPFLAYSIEDFEALVDKTFEKHELSEINSGLQLAIIFEKYNLTSLSRRENTASPLQLIERSMVIANMLRPKLFFLKFKGLLQDKIEESIKRVKTGKAEKTKTLVRPWSAKLENEFKEWIALGEERQIRERQKYGKDSMVDPGEIVVGEKYQFALED